MNRNIRYGISFLVTLTTSTIHTAELFNRARAYLSGLDKGSVCGIGVAVGVAGYAAIRDGVPYWLGKNQEEKEQQQMLEQSYEDLNNDFVRGLETCNTRAKLLERITNLYGNKEYKYLVYDAELDAMIKRLKERYPSTLVGPIHWLFEKHRERYDKISWLQAELHRHRMQCNNWIAQELQQERRMRAEQDLKQQEAQAKVDILRAQAHAHRSASEVYTKLSGVADTVSRAAQSVPAKIDAHQAWLRSKLDGRFDQVDNTLRVVDTKLAELKAQGATKAELKAEGKEIRDTVQALQASQAQAVRAAAVRVPVRPIPSAPPMMTEEA